jgi:alpha-D-ribose 1-methylphosphonate 5-triphosphate synthase subunit PhnH
MTVTKTPYRLGSFESQAIFRALLESLSRPGTVRLLPVKGLSAAVVPLALADVETTVAVLGDDTWAGQILHATGANPAVLGEAELVALRRPIDPLMIRCLRCGSAQTPELGAKVGIDCRRLLVGGKGEANLIMKGPGINGHAVIGVDGLDAEILRAIAAVNAHPPAGIDVWLVDQDDRMLGIPRSTRVTVQ